MVKKRKEARALSSLEDLRPASYNPREISADAIKGLEQSLDEFGDISGITWNVRTGNLVSGHQRLKVLLQKGAVLEDGSVVSQDEQWPVRVVDWDLEKEMRANVAANNKHIAGIFTDGLKGVLANIQAECSAEQYKALRFEKLIPLEAFQDYKDLDKELHDLSPLSDVTVFIVIPQRHKDEVLEWLANGRGTTAAQLGIGVLSRCGLL